MRLPDKMGCGRSKSASSTGSGSGGGAADLDNADFYQKAPAGDKESITNCSEDSFGQSRVKCASSPGDNNHRMKGGSGGLQTNGELKMNRENAKESKLKEKISPGPLAPHANITDSQLEFFRMLDEKIEQGQDYESGMEL